MPHPQEKTPDRITELPNPELNPLLNPTLGQNLGRWAEVYFTTSPEKREAAVGELLRELKASPVPEAAESGGEAPSSFEASEIPVSAPDLQCGECGHRYDGPQRFCGMCGAPLAAEQASSENYPLERTMAEEPARDLEPVFAQAPLFSMITPAPMAQSTFSDSNEITWLREKNLAAETQGASLGGARKY
ncbi:MAG: hypothetical protein WA628_26645, partial [Terriglobales bacterium]